MQGLKQKPSLLVSDRQTLLRALLFCAAAVLLSFPVAHAESAKAAQDDVMEMNGIRLRDYPDFQKWQQVTVRFRTDSGEMRFIFANKIAYRALISHVTDYPDGAVFAKIGVMTQDDPEFTSSKVPSGARRIQFMLRAKKKYAATGGWGYALLAPDGHRLNRTVTPENQAQACDVCHQLVKDSRGEVFAQPFTLLPDGAALAAKQNASINPQASFQDHTAAGLPEAVRSVLPPHTNTVRFIEGAMRDHVFSGTENEIQPVLIKESVRSGQPAMLLATDNNQFALVYRASAPQDVSCQKPQVPMKVYWSVFVDDKETAPGWRTLNRTTCVKS
jgi:hypothetical protein